MMTTKEYAKEIRKDLKNEFGRDVKFSVRTKYFSMGSEINIYIRSASSSLFKEDGNEMEHLKDEVIEKIKAIVDKYQIVESVFGNFIRDKYFPPIQPNVERYLSYCFMKKFYEMSQERDVRDDTGAGICHSLTRKCPRG